MLFHSLTFVKKEKATTINHLRIPAGVTITLYSISLLYLGFVAMVLFKIKAIAAIRKAD